MKMLIISLAVGLVLVLIGGGVFLLSDALNPEELGVNNSNTSVVQNTNIVANTNASTNTNTNTAPTPTNVNSGPGTTLQQPEVPTNYPSDVYLPPNPEVQAVTMGEESTSVAFFDERPGNQVSAELRPFMEQNGWEEEFEVREEGRVYEGTWTKGSDEVRVFMQLVNETNETANTSIEITY